MYGKSRQNATLSGPMKYQLHPVCAAWPPMPDHEIEALAADIKANGLLEPLTLDPQSLLLDGRNREEACERAGVTPTTIVYAGDPILFSLSKNKHRRHMTVDQIALVAATLVTTKQTMNQYTVTSNEVTIEAAAVAAGVPRTAIESARTVLSDATPEEVEAVKTGKAKLRATADRVRARMPRRGRGRPRGVRTPPTDGAAVRQFQVSIDVAPDDWEKFKALAAKEGLSAAAKLGETVRAIAASNEKTVSIHVLIEKLVPLFDEVMGESKKHAAAVSQTALGIIASEGRRLLNGWASGDESVRRVRGRVVSPKTPTKKRSGAHVATLSAD
jgi:ParB-like chromosome segregation protein Spo0J